MNFPEFLTNINHQPVVKDVIKATTSEKREDPSVGESQCFVFRGLLYALLSGAIYSFCGVLVKDLINIHPGQLAVYRYLAILSFSLPHAVYTGDNLFGPHHQRYHIVLRGIFGGANIFLHFVAFRYLPLGEATVIIFTLPVFVTVAGRIFLKESFGMLQVVSVFSTIIGVTFITGLPQTITGSSASFTTENIYGLVASFTSIIFGTARYILLRKLKDVHYSIVMFNCGWIAAIETTLITVTIGNFALHTRGLQQILIIAFGFLSHLGMVTLTVALQFEEAGPVATIRAAADIILSYIWQIVIFRDVPDCISIVGATLVGSSIALVGFRKWIMMWPHAKCSGFCEI